MQKLLTQFHVQHGPFSGTSLAFDASQALLMYCQRTGTQLLAVEPAPGDGLSGKTAGSSVVVTRQVAS